MRILLFLMSVLTLTTACNVKDKAENIAEKGLETAEKQIEQKNNSAELLKIVKQLPEYEWKHPYELPELNYGYDALKPVIDEKTMKTHHSKHHNGYTRKTNNAIEAEGVQSKPLLEIFAKMCKYPDGIRNNGGGFYNHALFWTFMTPGGSEFKGDIAKAIKNEFDSFDAFKSKFENAAASQFGSGWAWLIMTLDGKLAITHTSNQNNPLMSVTNVNGIPLLNIDVWEHAYYLQYQNKRTDYIKNYWKIVNWETVNERYIMASKVLSKK